MNKPLEYCTLMMSVPRHMVLVLAKLMRCCVVLADTCHGAAGSWAMHRPCALAVPLQSCC